MAYEVVMPYHLHMPSYFLETFTEYPFILKAKDLLTVCYYVLLQWNVRPAVVERTSYCNGTYILP